MGKETERLVRKKKSNFLTEPDLSEESEARVRNRLSWFWAGVFLAVLDVIVFAGVVTNRQSPGGKSCDQFYCRTCGGGYFHRIRLLSGSN